MKKQEIEQLINEAIVRAKHNGEWARVTEIICLLCDSIYPGDGTVDSFGEKYRALATALFVGAAENDPKALQGLLPFFYAVCGDRRDISVISDNQFIWGEKA